MRVLGSAVLVAYLEGAASLLDNVDSFQIRTALEPQDSLDCKFCKVLLVMGQNFAAQSGLGNVQQVSAERIAANCILLCDLLQPFPGNIAGFSVPCTHKMQYHSEGQGSSH